MGSGYTIVRQEELTYQPPGMPVGEYVVVTFRTDNGDTGKVYVDSTAYTTTDVKALVAAKTAAFNAARS